MAKYIILNSLLLINLSISCINVIGTSHDASRHHDCNTIIADTIDPEIQKKYVLSENQYDNKIKEYYDYKSSYFDNLTYNFGMNYKGSCGYIAIAMLLSYYDTFLSDDIIPENYDVISNGNQNDMIERRNSPGTRKDIICDANDPLNYNYGFDITADKYYNYIQSFQGNSLHAKLITIGAKRGYYNFNDNNICCGTNYKYRYNIINDYLNDIIGYKLNTDYTFSSFNGESSGSLSNEVRNFAIEQINLGNPVLLSISGKNGGHVVVAYDYDKNEDKLYCHMGWNASSTHATIEEFSFSRYKTALAINFLKVHSHSNNYSIERTVNNKLRVDNFCFHDCQIYTYQKGNYHSYDCKYIPYSNTFHTAMCKCGESVQKPHSKQDNNGNIIKGKYLTSCGDCGTLINNKQIIEMSATKENDAFLAKENSIEQFPFYDIKTFKKESGE